MAERFEVFDVTTPVGTSINAPLSTPMRYSDGTPRAVEIVFPSGCAGRVGARLDYGGVTLVPHTPGAWIRGDGEAVKWPLSGLPTGAGWVLATYNSGGYPHTLQVRFLLDEIRRTGPGEVALVPIDISAVNEEDAA